MSYRTFIVGKPEEVAHHASPYLNQIDGCVIEPEHVAREARTGDLAVFYMEQFDRFRSAWHALSEKGCLTLYAIDGILEWRNAWENAPNEFACPWTMRPVLSDKVACIGFSQARTLEAWGNTGKTEIVGVPRFDRITRTRVPPSPTFRLLVITAKCPGFTEEQTAKTLQSLSDLKNHLRARQLPDGRTIEVTWRLTKGLDKKIGVPNQLQDVTGQELISVLQRVDAVITTPSTTMLESMLSGRPTCLLDYTNSPRYVEPAWCISSPDHLDETIRQLAAPADTKLAFQEMTLNDALANQGKSSEAMADLVTEMIRLGHDCRAAGQPVRFPIRIVDPEPPTAVDMASCYPAFHPDVSRERNELAAYVAEARRTIGILQERNDVLEKAIEEAVEALHDVHKNPVAGPLIRLGDRLKALTAKIRRTHHNHLSPDIQVDPPPAASK